MGSSKKRTRDTEDTPEAVTNATAAIEPADSPPKKKQQQRRSLFVRSLPATATTESLIAYFSQSYPIKHATVVVDPATKVCKGYGFVTFADAEDAQRAQDEFSGKVFEGRKIKIEVAEPRKRDLEDTIPGAIAAGQAKPRSVPSAATLEAKAKRQKEEKAAYQTPRLIVRNLPWSIQKPEQLSELFRSYGKIKQVALPSKKPGLMSGFGFVLLRGKKNAEKAMAALNGKEIDGRTLAVDWAVEKEVWIKETQGEVKAPKAANGETSSGKDEDDLSGKSGDEDDEMDDADDGVRLDEEGEESFEDDNDGEEFEDDEDMDDEDDDDEVQHQQDSSSSTLFVRNLPFTTTDDILKEHFSTFGPIRYARIVLDPSTERPRGTAFVCFYNADDAMQCLREAPRPDHIRPQPNLNGAQSGLSLLQNEADDPSGRYSLDGRVLQLALAVAKNEASRLTEEGINKRGDRDKDKRRLYLLSEGTISSKSPLYALLSPTEIAMREASAKLRTQLIRSNPSLHLSLTRLSIRNIPRSITSQDLKSLAREALVGFATDVKEGKRTRLSKEELARGAEQMREAEQERKKRGVGVVKQAKVVFEGREGGKITESNGAGRSRGYGFVEYYTHRSALMSLRWLNGHVIDYKAKEAAAKGKAKAAMGKEEMMERKKRLIVEFAIENAQVVNRRKDRERQSKSGRERDGQETQGGREAPAYNSRFTNVETKFAGAANAAVGSGGKSAEEKVAADVAGKEAHRQRIIGRKRMARKAKRSGA